MLAYLLIVTLLAAPPASLPRPDLPVERIKLPAGFSVAVYAQGLKNARSMARASDGTIFVGTRTAGAVYALRDTDGDGRADLVWTIARGLNMPNGIAFRNGSLYVAEIHRVIRYDRILSKLDNPPKPVVVNGRLPTEKHHGWRYMKFGPDGKLYISIGAPCNACEVKDPYGTIVRMNPDGSGMEVFARGIRNSVGFAWAPEDNALWFTDNGRDMMGDDIPPDELNRAPVANLHFGFPYVHGFDIRDPEHGKKQGDLNFNSPAQPLGAHVAALGMIFYTGSMFPEAYRNQVLIAEHGSWNRSKKIGYRISLVKRDGAKTLSYELFASGWMNEERAWGRPVDLLQLPDGSLLVSDDHAGAIYRITFP